MHRPQQYSAPKVNLECPGCGQTFAYDSCDLKAGDAIFCPQCRIHFICCSKELFTALKHLVRLAS